jgi:hypothetical protein
MDKATEGLIRNRAHNCCEYCRMLQKYDDLPFQFDHIIAKTHGGMDDPDNRALACVPCNLYKGPNLSGVDPQTGKVIRLFDPRRQNWNRHFRWYGAFLEGKTQSGRTTVQTLRINMPIRVEFRQCLIGIGEFPPKDI